MERKPQNLANHVKFDPPFHFFLLPLLLVTLILAVVHLVRHYDNVTPWILMLLAIAVTLAGLRARIYALKVQDRLIRLEERMRIGTICADPVRSRIGDLTESQLVALRFASDAELPGLVERALSQSLSNKDIKKAVVNWRPDYFRV
ncbi:MAG TPA: DUF6526 family protein [Bryobacteraceae bacterium]|nr:DUF6526 family protein [Bryobacteraceae bacterium]